MEPMLLRPAGKDYLWGGTRLKMEYGKDLDMEPLAETWECSTHPDGQSIVASGSFKGKTLTEVLKKHPEFLGEKYQGKHELPILVKLIDAEQDLSIQVHPDDAYAWEHEGQPGKTEMWYVLDAKPEARLVYGFEHEVTREILEDAFRSGEFMKHLHQAPVSKGDVFYIPPGRIHAIGAGVLLVEVQQNSNLTYRIYDYDRVDKDGKRRPLHFEKAIQVMNKKPSKVTMYNSRVIHYNPGYCKELLCRCEFFEMERVQVRDKYTFFVETDSFQVLMCLDGKGIICLPDTIKEIFIKKGNCIFLPAGTGSLRITGQTNILILRR